MMPKPIWLLGVIVLLFIPLATAGCSEPECQPDGSGCVNCSDLSILSHNMTRIEDGCGSVEGVARNDGNKRFSYAEIEVSFYNADGDITHKSMNNILDLYPGQTWEFGFWSFYKDTYSYNISVGYCR